MNTFDYEKTRSPEFFQENRLRAHSDHQWLLEGREDPVQSLNGDWLFSYAPSVDEAPAGFYDPAFDASAWKTIPVPAHWQLYGYGHPAYNNVQYPWDGHEAVAPGEAPRSFNPTGSYLRRFIPGEIFRGRRAILRFEGYESGIAVWLNGAYVGYSEDGYTTTEFDVTELLKEGENLLAVRVFQFTTASWMEDQDFFRFGGIFRPVSLIAVPRAHAEDLRLTTELSDDYSEGVLRLCVKASAPVEIEAVLRRDGAEVCRAGAEPSTSASVELPVRSPRLWSAEDPFLYELYLQIRDAEGRLTETVTQPVGFRRFGIENGLMLLNGKRILFRGVNRHEFSADRGRAVTEEETLQDLLTMKRNNINAIRTCH